MKMKKNYILCILLTGIVLMTSCKKDQDFVTLRAVIDQPSKVYINSDRYPYWNEGDKVYVNNNSYVLQNISSTTAEIPNVASTANGFRAIYPSNLVAQGTNIGESTTVPVTLSNQTYRTFEDANNSNAITQKVELPMGAYTDDDILVFHNLCSVIRLNLTNSYSSSSSSEGLTINKITITAANAFLSGDGTATINDDVDNDKIVISSGKHDVSMYCGVSLARNEQRTFDIFVPEFSSDNINITVETTDGYIEARANGVNLGHNKIVTLTKSIESLIPYPATLLPGQNFNAKAAEAAGALSNIQHVVFEYGSSTTSQYEFQTSNSQTQIYGTYNAGTLTLSTSADKIRANRNCQQMFQNFTSLMETPNFDGFTSAKTSSGNYGDHFIAEGITSMYRMFMGCTSLTSFNLGVFANTYALKNMGEMFSGCTHLTGVTNTGFSGNSTFTTENVTTMHHLFNECTSLVSISALSSFNTGKVGEMNAMFYNCSALQSIDLSTFNTGKVTNMECMFYGCSNTNLTSLDLSSFNTESVSGNKSMKGMFQNCSNLTTITLPSNTNIKRVANMQSMFAGCRNLATINNFAAFFNNEENGTNNVLYTTQEMFRNCSSLTVIEFPSTFKTNNVISMYGMFLGCNNLSTLDISNFTTSRTDENIDMSFMFYGCNSLGSIAFNTNFTGGKVTNMNGMFKECRNLTSLNLNNFNTTYVTNMTDMFNNCNSLSSITMGTGYSVAASNLLFGNMFYRIGIGNSPQACTITCPTTVKTFFENDRGNTNNASTPSYVVFEPLSTK